MSKAKYDYLMDYIPDKELYKAVMFARKMMREGTEASLAVRKASKYYRVDMTDVAHYCAQVASRVSWERRSK